MRFRRWAAFAALCSVLGFLFVLGSANLNEARASQAEEQRFLELINGYRQAHGLGPLALSETLSRAAERHSDDMQTYGFFSHTTEASSYYPVGSSFSDRLAREGYPTDTSYIAENIASGQATAEEVFEAWRLSPPHNANMLGTHYSAIGIGQAGTYWTTDFGSVVDAVPAASETQTPGNKTKTPAVERQPVAQMPAKPETGKPETTGQTPVTQPHAGQPAIGPKSSEQAQDAEPDKEAALRAASTPPAAKAPAIDQSNAEEAINTKTAQPSDREQDIKEPEDAGTNGQASQAAAEEDDQESAAAEAKPAEAKPAKDDATGTASAGAASGEAVLGAASQGGTSGKAPTAMKELPRTGGIPLPLLLGAILLLSSLLVCGIARNRRTF